MDESAIIRGTAWIAILLFVAREAAASQSPRQLCSRSARWLNLAGCAVFIGHMLVSFHLRHGWSHADAYETTGRQTAELTGWNWGGGIYLNYVFAAMWCWEAAAPWLWPAALECRSAASRWSFRGFYLFMIFNAAFVFVPGPGALVGSGVLSGLGGDLAQTVQNGCTCRMIRENCFLGRNFW